MSRMKQNRTNARKRSNTDNRRGSGSRNRTAGRISNRTAPASNPESTVVQPCIRLRGSAVISALWRGNRRLQVLGSAVNLVAMALVFGLFWVLDSAPSLGGSVGTFIGFMVLCAVLVSKTTTDHAFSAKWQDLMRLRILGARPRWLIGAMISAQLPIALVSAVLACLPGIPVAFLFNLMLGSESAHLMAGAFVQALMQTVLIALACTVVAVWFSGRRVVASALSLSPVRQSRQGRLSAMSSGRVRGAGSLVSRVWRVFFTVVLAMVGIAWGVAAMMSDSDAAQMGIGVMPLCLCWALARTARPSLRRIGNAAARRWRTSSWVVVAMRDVAALKSTSLFSVAMVAVAVFVFMVGSQLGLDNAARTSFQAVFNDVGVLQTSRQGAAATNELARVAQKADRKALVLAPTRVEPFQDYFKTCDRQMRAEDEGEPNVSYLSDTSSMITAGSLTDFVPRSAISGDINDGIIATNAISAHVGDYACVAQPGGKWSKQRVSAVLGIGGGALGNYLVPSSAHANEPTVGTRLALVRAVGRGSAEQAANSATLDSTVSYMDGRAWISSLPTGGVEMRESQAGANRNGMYFTIYPILIICVVALISVAANDSESRRGEARAAWLIGMPERQWVLTGVARVGVEVGLSSLLALAVTLVSTNMGQQPRWSVLWHAGRIFIPLPQIALVLASMLLVVVAAAFLYRSTYRRVAGK